MDIMEPPTPIILEKSSPEIQEILKAESKYNINSNKGNSFNIIIKNLTYFIEITASNQDNKELNQFTKKYSFLNLKEIKFLSICDSIDEIYNELLFEFSKNNSTLLEYTNQIIINIPIIHSKCKEISFILDKRIKVEKEMHQDLYKLISNLQEQINLKDKVYNEKISLCNKEIDDLRVIIKCLDEDNKILIQKIVKLEKEILILKKDKNELNEKNNFSGDKNNINNLQDKNIFIDDKLELIKNPWTKEVDPNRKKFNFILEEGDYLAKTNNITLDSIRSMHKFESYKIYKLIYNINYFKRDFRIGFGHFGNCFKKHITRIKNFFSKYYFDCVNSFFFKIQMIFNYRVQIIVNSFK